MEVKCVMPRDELLKVVQENKVQHEAMRKEALAGYCEKAAAACEEAVADLKAGKPTRVQIWMLQPPEDHTRDYERAISMLTKTTQTEIELSGGCSDTFQMHKMRRRRRSVRRGYLVRASTPRHR